jgi:hypothetical protein
MFFEVDIFVDIRARNRSHEPVKLLSQNTSARYPSKKYIPFGHVISAIAIRQPVFV